MGKLGCRKLTAKSLIWVRRQRIARETQHRLLRYAAQFIIVDFWPSHEMERLVF